MPHPYTRFSAPSHIEAGSSLAELLGPGTIALIGESFASQVPDFELDRFVREASAAIEGLGVKPRATAIAAALRPHLPADDASVLAALVGALGPPLERTEKNGLAPLFYMPHAALLQTFATGNDDLFAAGLQANRELTTRFTAEFSIRAFLDARLAHTLRWLQGQTGDANPHIRRMVSEGTRPRLPWASHLKPVREDPTLTLPLLEALKDDPVRYVTRSVANHLGDIGKDHPNVLFATCARWLDETAPPGHAKERRWIVRHAVRNPAKHQVPAALELRRRARN